VTLPATTAGETGRIPHNVPGQARRLRLQLGCKGQSQPKGNEMIISIISVLISSIAVLGVAAGLLLQARQVRVSQVQAVRLAQLELMRMSLENPSTIAPLDGFSNPELYSQYIYLNWQIKYFEMGYEMNYFTEVAIRQAARNIFASMIAREWWTQSRPDYAETSAAGRRKNFFEFVDSEFRQYEQAPTVLPNSEEPDGIAGPDGH
jgi:hypothetical protein